jgi:hypothetical protein
MTYKNPAISKYLQLMELKNPVHEKPVFWWNKMDEGEFIKTIQACLWEAGIDHQAINWMKLLKGEFNPDKHETAEENQ